MKLQANKICTTGIKRNVTKGDQSNLGVLIPDGVKTEATLGVIEKPVVLIGLGNGNDICQKKWETNQ